jgi:hypothetical protein
MGTTSIGWLHSLATRVRPRSTKLFLHDLQSSILHPHGSVLHIHGLVLDLQSLMLHPRDFLKYTNSLAPCTVDPLQQVDALVCFCYGTSWVLESAFRDFCSSGL